MITWSKCSACKPVWQSSHHDSRLSAACAGHATILLHAQRVIQDRTDCIFFIFLCVGVSGHIYVSIATPHLHVISPSQENSTTCPATTSAPPSGLSTGGAIAIGVVFGLLGLATVVVVAVLVVVLVVFKFRGGGGKAHRELTKNDKLAEVKGMNLGYVCLIVLFTVSEEDLRMLASSRTVQWAKISPRKRRPE